MFVAKKSEFLVHAVTFEAQSDGRGMPCRKEAIQLRARASWAPVSESLTRSRRQGFGCGKPAQYRVGC